MERIVYTERIRELADILVRKLVVRKAKNLWATAMQHTKNALVEMNDAFSIGMYEGMENCYGDLLTTRWKELTFKAIKPDFAAIGVGPYEH